MMVKSSSDHAVTRSNSVQATNTILGRTRPNSTPKLFHTRMVGPQQWHLGQVVRSDVEAVYVVEIPPSSMHHSWMRISAYMYC